MIGGHDNGVRPPIMSLSTSPPFFGEGLFNFCIKCGIIMLMFSDIRTSERPSGDSNESSSFLDRIQQWYTLEHNHGKTTSWAPTPYGIDRLTAKKQRHVADQLQARSSRHIPPHLPPHIAKLVQLHVIARFHERAADNNMSRDTRLKKDFNDVSPELLRYYHRGERGIATPYQLLKVRQAFGFRSIELARLTHPFGRRIEELVPMRRAVNIGLVALNAHFLQDQPTYHVINGDQGVSVNPFIQDGLLMTRERRIADFHDGTQVKERSSFILRIDAESGFDHTIARKIRTIDTSNNKKWLQEVETITDFGTIAHNLLETNNFDAAIPLSTTTYAYNKVTEALQQLSETDHSHSEAFERIQKIALEDYEGMIFINSSAPTEED